MKRFRFSDAQIVTAIKQMELGVPIPELCRKLGAYFGDADRLFRSSRSLVSGDRDQGIGAKRRCVGMLADQLG